MLYTNNLEIFCAIAPAIDPKHFDPSSSSQALSSLAFFSNRWHRYLSQYRNDKFILLDRIVFFGKWKKRGWWLGIFVGLIFLYEWTRKKAETDISFPVIQYPFCNPKSPIQPLLKLPKTLPCKIDNMYSCIFLLHVSPLVCQEMRNGEVGLVFIIAALVKF